MEDDKQGARAFAATKKGELIGVRLPRSTLANLDKWIARQENPPSRAQAIRQALEQWLATMQADHEGVARPLEIALAKEEVRHDAEAVVDSVLAAVDLPPAEKARRKHKLTKVPGGLRS